MKVMSRCGNDDGSRQDLELFVTMYMNHEFCKDAPSTNTQDNMRFICDYLQSHGHTQVSQSKDFIQCVSDAGQELATEATAETSQKRRGSARYRDGDVSNLCSAARYQTAN